MDQFSAIRRQARELRSAARVQDTAVAVAAVRAAAGHLRLTIELLPPAAVDLDGAHGQLDRQFRTILARDDLPDAELAEVVAHEIAHFVVHDGPIPGYHPRAARNGGDPSQRIETYGIKERREAQANSFGREFILPRPLAKRLFLEGWRASRISSELGLRYETTLQQLADGLLLPDIPHRPTPARKAAVLPDASQQRAIRHRGRPFLVGAGPGTGKTRTLCERIISLLEEGVPASRILALTFSNKAARELSERLQDSAGLQAASVWAGTFHAFGLDTIRRHHALFGVPDDPRVLDGSEAVALLEEAFPALDIVHHLNLIEPAVALRDILRAISRAKDELCGWREYDRLAADMARAASTPEESEAAARTREVAVVYRHYQEKLERDGLVDYGDLIMRPTVLMRTDGDFQDAMRARFEHVLVDEYQDINRASARLVGGIVGDGDNLWVVGDARQSIYRFRGASATNVARFQSDHPRGERDRLEVNYRSVEEVVETFTAFGGTMAVSEFAGPHDLRADRGRSGRSPVVHVAEDAVAEMDILAGSIRDLEAAGVGLAEQCVLARSNGSLATVAAELEARDVPVLYLGPLFERPEVRDLLCVLSLISDDAGPGLVRVAGLPEYRVSLEDALAVVAEAKLSERRVIDLLRRAEGLDRLSPGGKAGLLALAQHLNGSTQGTTPWLALSRFLFDGSEYVRTVLSGQAPSDAMRRVAVRQLLDTLRAMPLAGHGSPIHRALERVRHMILLADERDLRQLPPELDGLDGVRLMTVHASKGLEFEAVHLPGLYAGAVPAPDRADACPPPVGMIEHQEPDAHSAEEECILFVAMSRARSHLRLYRPVSRNGRASNPSKFLARVPAQARGATWRSVPRSMPGKAYPPILEPAAPSELSASDIEGYSRCPRRFFYSRVLGLSGRARKGAYLDAHGCLMKAITYVRELESGVPYDPDRATAIFEEAWSRTDLGAHPFKDAYHRLVSRMLAQLHTSAAGAGSVNGKFSTSIGRESIGVAVDRVIGEGEGYVVRTIRSGRLSKSYADQLSVTLLLKAITEAYGASARVEAHHLLDGQISPLAQTRAKFGNRLRECEAAVEGMRQGTFDPLPSDFNCPRCPFLFVCAAPEPPRAA